MLAAPPGPNGLYPPPYSPYSGQPIIFFDRYANQTLAISRDVPRAAPHLIVEAFPTVAGTATVQVVDANGQAGQLTNCTDSNGVRKSISKYTKFLAKGVMERVAIQLTVASGAWSVWGTFTEQASDRSMPADRNPLPISLSYAAGAVGPHGQTTRATYTVPSGRKASMQHIGLNVYRDVIATGVGVQLAQVIYAPSGGSSVVAAQEFTYAVAVGTADRVIEGVSFDMFAGDQLILATSDTSTGGSFNYNLHARLTEYDI